MFGFLKRKQTKKTMPRVKATTAYKIVNPPGQYNYPAPSQQSDENTALGPYQRSRLLRMAQDTFRNSATLDTLIRTLTSRTIGVEGGKVILPWDGSRDMIKAFAKFTRNCDFFTPGLSLNEQLKLILTTLALGGDVCVVQDSTLVTDSGKLLVFEPQDIVSVKDDVLERHYGKGAKQSQGQVYDEYGRQIGIILSRSCRGQTYADEGKCWFLRRDPDAEDWQSDYFLMSNRWRPNQGRGVTGLASTLGTINDIDSLQNFSLQSAKLNAQMLMQILQDKEEDDSTELPSAFGDGTDFENMTDEQISAYVQAEQQNSTQSVSLDRFSSANAAYQVMPPGVRAEVLGQDRPSPEIKEFLQFLNLRTFSPFGLPEMYSSGKVSGADYKANTLYAEVAFRENQKALERLLDWVFRRWYEWALRKNVVKEELTEEQLETISWEWPEAQNLDEQSHAQAVRLQLENGTTTYRQLLGNNWRQRLEELREETQYFKDNGLVHPSYRLISGGESSMIEVNQEEEA